MLTYSQRKEKHIMKEKRMIGSFSLIISFLFLLGTLLLATPPVTCLADPPSSFDLRDVGGQNYVSGIRDQGSFGTCWTHGAMASMEGNLLITGNWTAAGESGEPNLSERHLDWWNGFNTHCNDDDPGGGGLTVHEGGDYMVTSAYLTRGEGAVREVDAPYSGITTAPDRYHPDYHYYYPRDIEWYVAGSDLSNINTIKQKIMDQGVMGTCMCYSGSFIQDYGSYYAHYQPPSNSTLPNHAIAIVGWDDNKVTQAPEGNGAWLCKNSWGYWGPEYGYFWISYYDKWCCQEPQMGAVSLHNVEPLAYDNIYYRDYHGWRDTKEDCSEAFNAFTAESPEVLRAVSFFTAADNVTYTVKIYDRFEGGQLLDELSSKSGFIEFTGFHTVDLDATVALDQGEDFYIYLEFSDGGHPYDRTSDVPVLLGAQYRVIVESAADPGESYYWSGSEWLDLYYYDDPPWTGTLNFCIKGLATERGMQVSPSGDFKSEGPVGGPFSPSSMTYRLENKNDSPIQYLVFRDTSSLFISLSGDVEGIMPASGTAEVTVEINSSAETFSGGLYFGVVGFSNLTDHLGDTYREVLLVVGDPVVHHEWTLEGDPGWTTEGDWAFGEPTGGGGSHGGPDPVSGHTGSNVYGYNLSGDYDEDMSEMHLTSPAIDCSGLFNVYLNFWRWLGVEDGRYDHAYVRVSNDQTNWITVWENPAGAGLAMEDTSWIEMNLDISAVADNQPTVYLRWTMGESDGGWQYCGWNIDDIQVTAYQYGVTCGDVNADGSVDAADIIALINYLYLEASPPQCQPITSCADVNLDGEVDVGDIVYLINYLFIEGPEPCNP